MTREHYDLLKEFMEFVLSDKTAWGSEHTDMVIGTFALALECVEDSQMIKRLSAIRGSDSPRSIKVQTMLGEMTKSELCQANT